MAHRFVWVDIPVLDLDRAIAFYAAVLGCAVSREGGPGFAFGVLEHHGLEVAGCLLPVPAAGASRAAATGAPADDASSTRGPLVYLNAEGRLAAAVDAAVAHGGRLLDPIVRIGPHGFRAIVLDSEGNRVALHAPTA